GEYFQRALSDRLNKFGLRLNQSKTRLIEFGRFAKSNFENKNKGKPETFDFLGFTHYCSVRKSDGGFKLGRKTIAKKMKAKLIDIKEALRARINQDVYSQGRWLKKVVQGFYNYHAIPGNCIVLDGFKTAVSKLWLKTLKRRSQKSTINWKKLTRLIRLFIPSVTI
ncbi:MAG: group II intron reverse transcriptase/maturase, partial [Candidatus Korarchaeota archaeon]|nr:group II intron reverse transcriptase/maturase [Candidatus Korarchaeota archaeon]NIR52961.1 group II intron reverse transcriptase/maturase [candidate division KSB1 bacterium]NIS28222.1 group II intron reverse transcriptase/maturase [candidate division KSB1 bacterium]NIU28900.1 group II intron reverse transcriptase/maturase [candidate division KSB1 bacterium]NIU90349.1 group II intron reverse transcriptase/maturase [candidate division KSB1 bacterium]